MSTSAIITNAALVAFTSTLTVNRTWATRIWIFVAICAGVYGYVS